MADRQLGERERDAGDAVEERDLLHAPAGELRHVVEDDEDGDEVEERDEEDADDVECERRAVLPLGAYASRDEPRVEGQWLSHPARPAFAFLARTPRRQMAKSAISQPACMASVASELGPGRRADEDVDRELEHARERRRVRHRLEPLREEADRDDEAGEEGRERDRDTKRSAVVEHPERREVVQEAKREADGDREHDADEKHGPDDGVARRRQVEDDRADYERRQPAEERVVEGAPVVGGEARPQRMHGPDEVGGDVAALDPPRKVRIAEDPDGREHRLRQPDVRERLRRVVAADVLACLVEREQDIRLDEAEDGVREDACPGRGGIGRKATVAADGQLPLEAHGEYGVTRGATRSTGGAW